ncbi:MAG: VWA domain-containing protein [Planctomycetes bacterium]|nr:VWA domain-containing protein [Planctomycetota bacterium]
MIALAFDTPLALFALALALPLIALFLLRRKRRDELVSSTMLWQRALKETLARSPFRKPSEWLSLLLMLTALVAAVLGGAGLRLGSGGAGRALVLVIDVSASMATKHDGASRMEIALRKANEAVDALKEGDEVTLISAGSTPSVLAHATRDRPEVRRILSDVRALPIECDMRSAMALAIAEAQDGAAIVVLSDFCQPERDWNDLERFNAPVTLVRCGEPSTNAGITHAAVFADEGGVSLLARVAGSGKRTLALYVDDQLSDARDVSLGEDETSVVFSVQQPPEKAGVFKRAKLKLEPGDEFETDDVAYIALGRTDPPRVLHVGAPDPFISRLEAAVPGLIVHHGAPADSSFDLAIITEPTTSVPNARREFYFGCAPPESGITVSGEIAQPEIADWEGANPTLRGVGVENLLFAKAALMTVPARARILVSAREGPLLLELSKDNRGIYVWACGINDSNLVLRPAFPVLMRNLLGNAIHRIAGSAQPCGSDLVFPIPKLSGETSCTIEMPQGRRRTASMMAGEAFVQRAPLEPGFYAITSGNTKLMETGAALNSRAETQLKAIEPRQKPTEVEYVSANDWRLERPVWRWCAAIALIAMLVEIALWIKSQRARARTADRQLTTT